MKAIDWALAGMAGFTAVAFAAHGDWLVAVAFAGVSACCVLWAVRGDKP